MVPYPIGIQDYSAVSNLGSTSENIRQALTNNNNYLELDHSLLVESQPTWVGRIKQDYLDIDYSQDRFDSRYYRIAQSVLTPLANSIEKIKSQYHAKRIGVIIGTSTSGIADNEPFIQEGIRSGHMSVRWSYFRQEVGILPHLLKKQFQFQGPAIAISTACSSGAKIFASAAKWIYADYCDAVLIGGIDTLCQFTVNGFNSLASLSSNICQPFASHRDGINIGEAAAFFVVSKTESPIQLLSFGESTDAYHISSPHPEGKGAVEAMQSALNFSDLKFEQIDYLNLHGTGTMKNDAMEGIAVQRVFQDYPVLLSSTKHKTGHCLGAAGALEAYFCCEILKSTKDVWLPYHQTQGTSSEFSALNFVSTVSVLPSRMRYIMSNSFAFGGSNCSLILGSNS